MPFLGNVPSSFNVDTNNINNGAITTEKIADGAVVNADVSASAAIAGTKISPDFGSQNIATTGLFSHALGTAGAPTITFTGDVNTGIYSPGADQLAISTGGSGRLFVDSSGNVGLGGAPKGWGGGAIGALFNGSGSITAFSDEVSYGNNVYFNGAWRYARNDTAQLLQLGSGDIPLIFYSAATGTADASISWSERFRVDASGRLGVGTSNPSALFTAALPSATSGTIARFSSPSYDDVYISAGASTTSCGIGTISSSSFNLYVNSSSRMLIDSSGRVGIGTTSPTDKVHLHEASSNANYLHITNDTTGSAGADGVLVGLDSSEQFYIYSYENNNLIFGNNNTERARIDNSGRLLVGTSSSANDNIVGTGYANLVQVVGGATGAGLAVRNTADVSRINIVRSANLATNTEIGNLSFGAEPSTSVERARIACFTETTGGSGGRGGNLRFYTCGDGSATPTERMKIDSAGRILVNEASSTSIDKMHIRLAENSGLDGVRITGNSYNSSPSGTNALRIIQNVDNNSANSAALRIDHENPLAGTGGTLILAYGNRNNSTAERIWQVYSYGYQIINRPDADGTLIDFQQAQTTEGSISVSGTTVSYNGAHLSRWSQVQGIDPHDKSARPDILRGTVMSNLDEMCEWLDEPKEEVLWTQKDLDIYLFNGCEGLPNGANVGDIKEPAKERQLQDNEQLNKTKISDAEGDKNVAGVFQCWDDDDDTWVNDYYLAMTGDFVIRIGAGVTVERGDLLMSAGDGTAKPQDDDIIRSKTIAKVTSTNVSCTYDDGSYCVPCVLMAC